MSTLCIPHQHNCYKKPCRNNRSDVHCAYIYPTLHGQHFAYLGIESFRGSLPPFACTLLHDQSV